jgi:uncharacterized repeat protein (TIGR03803 family)
MYLNNSFARGQNFCFAGGALAALLMGLALPSAAWGGDIVLHSFAGASTNDLPNGSLIVSGSSVYGTTGNGTIVGFGGTVYGMDLTGGNYHVLHTFPSVANDGANPLAGLALVGSTLWGTTTHGGNPGPGSNLDWGTNFQINTDGTGYQTYSIWNGFGPNIPAAVLANNNGLLFGVTVGHELTLDHNPSDNAIYSIATSPSNAGQLGTVVSVPSPTNLSTAVAVDNTKVYGALTDNGIHSQGAIFSASQSSFTSSPTILHTFLGPDGNGAATGLLVVGSTIYGTEPSGGTTGNGTIFAMNTDGSNFHVLHSLNASEGSAPGGLTLIGSQLFGIASAGGAAGKGAVWTINEDGSAFSVLASLQGGANHAANPLGGLVLENGMLYGVSSAGGANNAGTIFTLPIPEPSSVVLAGIALLALSACAWWKSACRASEF